MLAAALTADSYSFHIWVLPPLITTMSVLLLGVLVALRERFSRVARFFLLYTLALTIWLASGSLVLMSNLPDTALLWTKVCLVGVIFVSPSMFQLSSSIAKTESQDRAYIAVAWVLASIISMIALSTNLIVDSMRPWLWGYYPNFGWFGVPAFTVFLAYLSAAIYKMVRLSHRVEKKSIPWRRARLFTLAYGIGVFAVTDLISTTGFDVVTVGYIPVLFHVFVMAYVTLRYRLVDITPEIAAQRIVDTMTDALIVLDMEKNVRLANPAAERLFGLSRAEAAGKSLMEMLHDPVAAGYMEAMLSEGSVNQFELKYQSQRRESRTLAFSATTVRDNMRQAIAYVCILRDITQKRQAQSELERRVTERTAELVVARDSAMEASRTKSAFLANMSHVLRTPLNAIIGYSELLEEDARDRNDKDFIDDLRKIRKAGNHLLDLVSMVLDLSKVEAGKLELCIESFSVEHIINDVVDAFKPIADKNNNTLIVECPKDIGDMVSDSIKIRQTLMNLLSNACKFTRNGKIEFRISRERGDDGDRIIFVVADSGIGMTPEQQQHLFSEFSQADAATAVKYGGTGLGLAISRRFCQLLGGDILVDSEYGAGSVFTVALPARIEAPSVSTMEAYIKTQSELHQT